MHGIYSSAFPCCTLSHLLCLVKNQGNDKYKKSEYKMAIGQYHRALLYLKAIDASQKNPAEVLLGQSSSTPLSPELRHDVDRLYADCQSNLAGKVLFHFKCLLYCWVIPGSFNIHAVNAFIHVDSVCRLKL